ITPGRKRATSGTKIAKEAFDPLPAMLAAKENVAKSVTQSPRLEMVDAHHSRANGPRRISSEPRMRGMDSSTSQMRLTNPRDCGGEGSKVDISRTGAVPSAAVTRSLVIVESPTKARSIGQFLRGLSDDEVVVEASMGHIRDLPGSAKDLPERYRKEPWAYLAVNVEEGFEPVYVLSGRSKDQVK